MADDSVKTQRIELTDEDGETALVVTGRRRDGRPGLVVRGPNSDDSAEPVIAQIEEETGLPTVQLNSPAGGFIRLSFHPTSGLALIQVKNADGTGGTFLPPSRQ